MRLDRALPALRKAISPTFDYTEHSIAQVDSFVGHMKGVITDGPDHNKLEHTRQLTPDEVSWILNERTLSSCSFMYWAMRYGVIRDTSNHLMRYAPNLAQKAFLDILSEMEADGVELILQFLKARRLGISTICQLILAHRFIFYPDTFGMIASDNPKDSDKLSKMFFLAYDHSPAWLRPQISRYSKGNYYEFSNGNRVDIQHGSQEADMGRGENPNCFHISEMAKVQDPASLIDSGLMRAVLPSTDNFGVFEGTAEGDEGWWYDKYWFNKENYGKPGTGARMRPTFLPWYVGVEIYPSPVWLRTNKWEQIASEFQPKEATAKEAKRAENFVRSFPLLRRHLGKDWQMSREQMYFYEASIVEYKRNNTLHVWSQEMASDDVSAWQSREQSVFDPELRLAYRQSCDEPLHVFGIRGGGIPQRFWPQKKDWKLDNRGQPIIHKLTADWTPSLPALNFEFVELKFHGYSNSSPFGKLFVWEEPANGETYAFGADQSNGYGEKRSDNSVLEVFRKGSRWKLDAQIAEFASPDMSGADLWLIGMAVGTYYSVFVNGKLKQPRCVPEINREGGVTFLREMQRHGWKEFHMQVKMKAATRRGQPSITYGWYSDNVNRPDMFQRGSQAIKEEYIRLQSPWLVNELDTLIYDPVNRKIGAAKGKHDDRLTALWLPFISIYDDEIRATGRSPFQERQRVVSEEEKYPHFVDAQAYDLDAEVIRG